MRSIAPAHDTNHVTLQQGPLGSLLKKDYFLKVIISPILALVLSKDPVLRYQVGTKKMKTSRYQVSVNPVLAARSESCADALASEKL